MIQVKFFFDVTLFLYLCIEKTNKVVLLRTIKKVINKIDGVMIVILLMSFRCNVII